MITGPGNGPRRRKCFANVSLESDASNASISPRFFSRAPRRRRPRPGRIQSPLVLYYSTLFNFILLESIPYAIQPNSITPNCITLYAILRCAVPFFSMPYNSGVCEYILVDHIPIDSNQCYPTRPSVIAPREDKTNATTNRRQRRRQP